jgi:hypothetical protein
MDLSFLKQNYILVAIAVVFAIAATAILNLSFKQPNEDKSYIKTVIVATLVSAFIVYVHASEGISLDENIISGPPPF